MDQCLSKRSDDSAYEVNVRATTVEGSLRGTSLRGTSLRGTSLGGTSLGGTSLGGTSQIELLQGRFVFYGCEENGRGDFEDESFLTSQKAAVEHAKAATSFFDLVFNWVTGTRTIEIRSVLTQRAIDDIKRKEIPHCEMCQQISQQNRSQQNRSQRDCSPSESAFSESALKQSALGETANREIPIEGSCALHSERVIIFQDSPVSHRGSRDLVGLVIPLHTFRMIFPDEVEVTRDFDAEQPMYCERFSDALADYVITPEQLLRVSYQFALAPYGHATIADVTLHAVELADELSEPGGDLERDGLLDHRILFGSTEYNIPEESCKFGVLWHSAILDPEHFRAVVDEVYGETSPE